MDFLILYTSKNHSMTEAGKDGGLIHLIGPIRIDQYILKIETPMSTISADHTNLNDITTDDTTEEKTVDPTLIKWEEWSLSAEEHFHALQKFRENPKGRPLGHKA